MTQLERLVQEHAIYKAFFFQFLDMHEGVGIVYEHIKGESVPIRKIEHEKSAAFNVVRRLRALDNGIMYCDPTWMNADKELFTKDIESLKSDSDYIGPHVSEEQVKDFLHLK